MEQAGMGVDVGDVNEDGRFDIFVTNFSDDYNTLYLNQGGLRFVDSSDLANLVVPSLPYLGWSTRLADLDADGDLDIFVVNGHVYPQVDEGHIGESLRQDIVVNVVDEAPVLIRNQISGATRAVVLELIGRVANRDGLGAVVRARIGDRRLVREVGGDRGYLSHSDPRVYLGLGAANRVDEIRIQWPGGGEDALDGLESGSYALLEGKGIVNQEGR
jgi:hypothetical protein